MARFVWFTHGMGGRWSAMDAKAVLVHADSLEEALA